MSAIHRNLRSAQAIWQGALLPIIPSSAVVGTIETDVIIVGAGNTGAIIADVITEVGFNVAVVDRAIGGLKDTVKDALQGKYAFIRLIMTQ